MMPAPLSIPALLAPALLVLSACGDGTDGQEKRGERPAPPLGFELAAAGLSPPARQADAGTAPAPALIELTPEELAARIAAGKVRVIDVRTDAEVAEGVIAGAEHILLDRFDPATLDLSDGREVVLYCRSGRRSAIAGQKLAEATGRPAEHLAGGMLAWEAAGQPVAQPPE